MTQNGTEVLQVLERITREYGGTAVYSNFMKICPVGVELFLEDRRTDTKLIAAFRNFANAPNKAHGNQF
jgi:hypothetical protein